MGHRVMGLAHANLLHLRARLIAQHGQGTVEYVGLILLIAGVLAAVVATNHGDAGKGIAGKVTKELQQAIDSVVSGGKAAKG